MTLPEFLLARIDERRTEAERLRELGDRIGQKYGHSEPPEDDLNLGDLAYFAMHKEADRVLAECEAKRRIVEHISRVVEYAGDPPGVDINDLPALTHVLQLLALPYANHPDYWQEWKP